MKRLTIIIVLLLSLFGIADLFRPGYYSSHDGVGHVIRMEEFYRSFNDGQIPVRWSERLYFGYGYPFYNFNYPSIYYFGVPLMKLGMSATDAMKSETIFSFIISGALMFLYLRRKVAAPYAVFGAVLYLYAPYRLSNIYVRGSVAEAMAFIFPPLLLWGAESLKNKRNILKLGLVFGLLGVSHNISALLLTAFFFGYLLILAFSQRSLNYFFRGVISFVLGLMIAAFFMVPALLEKKWTFLDLTIAKDYPDHFVYPWQLILPNWGYGGSIKGPDDGMSFSLGLVQVAAFFFALKYWRKNVLLFFCFLTILVSVFFMFEPSKFLWDKLPLLPFVQFPWRFTMLTVPAFAVIGSLGLSYVGKRIYAVVLIAVTLLAASYMIFRNQTENVIPVAGDALAGSTTWAHEQATRWLVPKPDHIPAKKIEKVPFEIISWKTGEHRYRVEADRDTTVTENTMYYPGWQVAVDGVLRDIDYSDGRINYKVTAGRHEVVSRFGETPMRQAVDLISLGTFSVVVLYLLGDTVLEILAKHKPRL